MDPIPNSSLFYKCHSLQRPVSNQQETQINPTLDRIIHCPQYNKIRSSHLSIQYLNNQVSKVQPASNKVKIQTKAECLGSNPPLYTYHSPECPSNNNHRAVLDNLRLVVFNNHLTNMRNRNNRLHKTIRLHNLKLHLGSHRLTNKGNRSNRRHRMCSLHNCLADQVNQRKPDLRRLKLRRPRNPLAFGHRDEQINHLFNKRNNSSSLHRPRSLHNCSVGRMTRPRARLKRPRFRNMVLRGFGDREQRTNHLTLPAKCLNSLCPFPNQDLSRIKPPKIKP